MTEREAFEAWAKEKLGQGYSLLIEEGVYFDKVTRWAFKAWKASRQQALEEAAKVCERIEEENWKAYKGRTDPVQKDRLFNPHTEGCSDGATECAASIRSLTTTGDKA